MAWLTPTMVVGCCVRLGQRSRRWADGSRMPAIHQTEPKSYRERMPHRLHRRPLFLHYRYAAEEPAQVHRSHRGRKPNPIHPLGWKRLLNLERNNAFTHQGGLCDPLAPPAWQFFLSRRCSPCFPSKGKLSPNSPILTTLQTFRWASTGNQCF